ncbi:MAG: hypothetical protein ACLFV4_04655 [Candidatus Hydrogenedentota bacterium]
MSQDSLIYLILAAFFAAAAAGSLAWCLWTLVENLLRKADEGEASTSAPDEQRGPQRGGLS